MILVTCANGTCGRRLVKKLAGKGMDIRAMDINPAVEELKELYGVKETIVGDGNKPADVAKAMEGIDMVVYQPAMLLHCETNMAKLAIDAAVEAGVKKFVMLSVIHPNMSGLLQHTAKLKAEEYLVYKGLTHGLNYTILQPQHYCHNFDVNMVEAMGAYTCFYDKNVKLGLVDVDDVAEAVYCVLTQDIHQNATYELCGPSYLTSQEQTDIYNKITGKQVPCVETNVEDFIEMIHLTDSYSKDGLRGIAHTYGTVGIAGNPNVLQWVTGKPATSFEEYLKRNLAQMEDAQSAQYMKEMAK